MRHYTNKHSALLVILILGLTGMSLSTRADPVVDEGLKRLAGTLGAVHYLRVLCKPSEGQVWRLKMLDMLAASDLSQSGKDALIGSFNAAYSRQQRAHPTCTQAAANLGNTYARQGAQEAKRLAGRLSGQLSGRPAGRPGS